MSTHEKDHSEQVGTVSAESAEVVTTPNVLPGIYAVQHDGEWHIAEGDGDAYRVTSDWQSGDRWIPEWLDRVVLLETAEVPS